MRGLVAVLAVFCAGTAVAVVAEVADTPPLRCDTNKAILMAYEEAYYPDHFRYGTMEELVDSDLMKRPVKTHTVQVLPDGRTLILTGNPKRGC